MSMPGDRNDHCRDVSELQASAKKCKVANESVKLYREKNDLECGTTMNEGEFMHFLNSYNASRLFRKKTNCFANVFTTFLQFAERIKRTSLFAVQERDQLRSTRNQTRRKDSQMPSTRNSINKFSHSEVKNYFLGCLATASKSPILNCDPENSP
ncbi:uncharacterized protein LOC144734056 [Lampetra planeri]